MAHHPKPFFVKSCGLWYVQIDGKQHNLGRDEAAAQTCYHELMAARGKAQPVMVQPAARTVVSVLEEFMERYASETAPRTYEHYRRFLKSFRLSLPEGLTIDDLAPGH